MANTSLSFPSIYEAQSSNFLEEKTLISFRLYSDYYQEYYQNKYKDLSFAILRENKVLGYVICSVLDNKLVTPDRAVNIFLSNLNLNEHKKIYLEVVAHLTFLAKNHGCLELIIKDQMESSSLSLLSEILFNQRFESKITFEMNVDFTGFSEKEFHSSLRKSYKSLINWGKTQLKTHFLDKNNLNRSEFDGFRDFHYKISGRKTRSQKTWDIQYNMIEAGMAELITSTYNNQLVAGSLFSNYGSVSTYFTGVYERSLFEFGISHFLLYAGIVRAHEKNCTTKFSLGYFDTDIKDPKWYNIQFFKKGFCENLTPILLWSKEIL